jgi:HTH-type transcriptional regulator, cell division transcriptional repressor
VICTWALLLFHYSSLLGSFFIEFYNFTFQLSILYQIREHSRGTLKLDNKNLESEKEKIVKEIGQRLRTLRVANNLNAGEIYKLTGISTGNTSSMETGKTFPSAYALIKLSELYNVSTDWILKGKTPENKGDQDLITVGDILQSDIDEELAAYLRYILKAWHEGERDRHWVMKQLERAFEDVGKSLKEEKAK